MELRDRIKAYLKESGISQTRFAKTIGVNNAYLSKYLTEGDIYIYTDKVKSPAEKYLNNQSIKKGEAKTNNTPFVFTRDAKMAFFVMDDAVSIGKMAIVSGAPGSGKTRTLKEYANLRPNAVLIEATIKTRGVELFNIIAKKLGVRAVTSQDVMVRECAEELKRSEKFFIVDEAEHLPYAALELLRRLHDFSGRALILAGTDVLVDNLRGANSTRKKAREYRQLSSRIVGKCEFKGLVYSKEKDGKIIEESEDLISFCAPFLKDVDAIKAAKHLARGNVRKTENLLERAERLANINNGEITEDIVREAAAMVYLD
ncbi:MAG: AAA family ATPase [Campylobacteraceae bacterium]|jgi:DNA transposition AAA+ family ATPase|nr:AAA family ATPase [Campylobacteraceae bacterium]